MRRYCLGLVLLLSSALALLLTSALAQAAGMGDAALTHPLKVENDGKLAAGHLDGRYAFKTEFPKAAFTNGTDHGTTAPHFIIGGKIKDDLHSKPPALQQLENSNLTYGVDFRSLYSTVHEKWWRLPASSIPGGHFTNLNIIRT